MDASLLSINGKLTSLYRRATSDDVRSSGYREVGIGRPLMIRYLYFFLKYNTKESKNELMISTFLKIREKKKVAAETVNFFDSEVIFDSNGQLRITDFGAARYGHPLCYYARSYLGESIYLTTKIMELDKVDQKIVDAIQGGIGTIAGLPAFAEFLPYAVGASVGVSLFQNIIDLFNRDDAIVRGHNLDLHFGLQNVRQLQSGRIVCIPGREEKEFLEGEKYELTPDNRLVDVNSGQEFTENSYFVIQINASANNRLESFNYMAGAADLLKQTNRGGDTAAYIARVVDLFRGYNDLAAMQEIEDLAIDVDEDGVKEKVKALHRSMSRETRVLYRDRVKNLIGS